MSTPTPGPWEVYDPCYGTCPIGGMPCTPEGCHESHPVGDRAVSGPLSADGGHIELMEVADAHLIAASPDLLAACLAMLGTWGGQDEDAIIAARDMAKAAIEKAIGGAA